MKCVYHFGASYIDGMTGDPFFILDIGQWQAMKANTRFEKNLTVMCFNPFSAETISF